MNVRVLMLEAPTDLLEERARRGLDRWDEMWDGVLHVVPAPANRHQRLVARLVEHLSSVARARGLQLQHETNLYRPGRDDDFRIPDVVVYDDAVSSQRGVEGAAAAVFEVHSPGDEAYEKIAWYLDVGVGEVVIVDRDTLSVEVFRELDPDGQPVLAEVAEVQCLDVTLTRVDDDRLHLAWPDGEATADLA